MGDIKIHKVQIYYKIMIQLKKKNQMKITKVVLTIHLIKRNCINIRTIKSDHIKHLTLVYPHHNHRLMVEE
jgi:hypothetical protein